MAFACICREMWKKNLMAPESAQGTTTKGDLPKTSKLQSWKTDPYHHKCHGQSSQWSRTVPAEQDWQWGWWWCWWTVKCLSLSCQDTAPWSCSMLLLPTLYHLSSENRHRQQGFFSRPPLMQWAKMSKLQPLCINLQAHHLPPGILIFAILFHSTLSFPNFLPT